MPSMAQISFVTSSAGLINLYLSQCNFSRPARIYFALKTIYLGISSALALYLHKGNRTNKNTVGASLPVMALTGPTVPIPVLPELGTATCFLYQKISK